MCVHVYACVCACVCTRARACVRCVCECVCMCTYTCVCMCTLCVRAFVCLVCARACVCESESESVCGEIERVRPPDDERVQGWWWRWCLSVEWDYCVANPPERYCRAFLQPRKHAPRPKPTQSCGVGSSNSSTPIAHSCQSVRQSVSQSVRVNQSVSLSVCLSVPLAHLRLHRARVAVVLAVLCEPRLVGSDGCVVVASQHVW
jgi:hypothetical protein